MASDFEVLRAAFDAAGVTHLVFDLNAGLGSQADKETLVQHHNVPEDVIEAGGLASGVNVNGLLMFFDGSGRYVGNTDTTRAFGPRFERAYERVELGAGIFRAGERV